MGKRIELSGTDQFCEVDDADWDWLSESTWFLHERGYAVRNAKVDGKRVRQRMHRLIMDAPKGVLVDHINRNPLDNRRENLRLCDDSQNAVNRVKKTKSGYKGVTKQSSSDHWTACVYKHGKKYYVGSFETAEEAARAYDKMARQIHGDFVVENFKTYTISDLREKAKIYWSDRVNKNVDNFLSWLQDNP